MAGLAKICKLYGRMTTRDETDKAVHEKDMPEGSERWKASERAKWEGIAKREAKR